MESKAHWERIYQTKQVTQVSWYQLHPAQSLRQIQNTGVGEAGAIIDVGGGASTLVDHLLEAGFQNLTVLDISGAALEVARGRLGVRAAAVTWLEADITRAVLSDHHYDVWHDRAVFHFLTESQDRLRYVATVKRAVKPGGHVIVATFASDGPERCSGLDVVRYDSESLHEEFGADFVLLDSTLEEHHTPFGASQKFVNCYCRKQ